MHGPANCGKPFIVSPLKVIYKAFSNPAPGSFARIGAEEAEIIYLNDFWWHPKIIAWPQFLQALEGDTVHLPAPKNLCSKDIELSKETPFFCDLGCPTGATERGCDGSRECRNNELPMGFFPFLEANTTWTTGEYTPVQILLRKIYFARCAWLMSPLFTLRD